MNTVIELLLNHRSIRRFKPIELSEGQTELIIASAQAASSSSNGQAYTIIGVADPGKKKELARLAGHQAYVEQSGLFLVFCADLSRLKDATEALGATFHQNTESFLVATVDAALAAQNATVAAESLGLGACYIGGIRNHPQEVSDLLELPDLVYPVFGLTIGVPDQETSRRPRFPRYAVYHEDRYRPEQSKQGVQAYDETMEQYYAERTQGKSVTNWSRSAADKYKQPMRPHIRPFLEGKGFRLT